jgi:signal-transduction protein with cAMP-binding, CBS, and nucleotidyltransferase domain
MKIYHLAQEIKYRKGDIVIEKNHKLKHLLLMINGSVDICDHDQVMAQVLKGNFLGEMSYISNNKTTASAYVNSDEANCLLWNRTSLQQLELDDNPLYNKFLQSISQNLVEKLLASSSLKMKSEHLPNGK